MNAINRNDWYIVGQYIKNAKTPRDFLRALRYVDHNPLRSPVNNKRYKIIRIVEAFKKRPSVESGDKFFMEMRHLASISAYSGGIEFELGCGELIEACDRHLEVIAKSWEDISLPIAKPRQLQLV